MCFNTSILSICKQLPLNPPKQFKIKVNSFGLKINPIIDRVYWTLERVGNFLTLVRKIARKAVCLTQIIWNLVYTTHLWTLNNISCMIRMMSTLFLMMLSFNNNFFCLSIFSFAESQQCFLKSNQLNLR